MNDEPSRPPLAQFSPRTQPWVLAGVAGSGKTTVGLALAQASGRLFLDADDFHSETSRLKMAADLALDDGDRMPWLVTLNAHLRREQDLARSDGGRPGVVLACSALKAIYRRVLGEGLEPPPRWIWLEVSPQVLQTRLAHRQHAFFPASLLPSQWAAAEVTPDLYRLSCEGGLESVVQAALAWLTAPDQA